MAAQDSISARRLVSTGLTDASIARLWLHMYQFGPVWVRPVIAAGTLSNAYLACVSSLSLQRALYASAALSLGLILLITFTYFEPGVNGGGKVKAAGLLRNDGLSMPPGNGIPSVYRHSASNEARKWAEKTDMAGIVATWGRLNNGRWAVAAVAAAMSGYATFWA